MFEIDICIPTYNRPDSLLKTLNLIDLDHEGLKLNIFVVDNASDVNLDAVVKKAYPANYNKNIFVVRNRYNLGMSANIMRCFELGASKYLYIMSDDDLVTTNFSGALQELLSNFKKDEIPDIIKLKDKRNLLINNYTDFLNTIDDKHKFNSFIFLSNVIYKRSSIEKFVEAGYQNCDSYVPHFMMINSLMLNGGKIRTVTNSLVQYVVPSIGYNYALVAGIGVGSLKNVLLRQNHKNTKLFHSVFYPHNDVKVLVDLRAQCCQVGSVSDYNFLGRNYLFLISRVRSAPRYYFLLFLFYLLKPEFIFRTLFLNNKWLPSIVLKNIAEIKKRYKLK